MPRKRYSNESILQALREGISSHQLTPGSRLSEQQLSDEFGVSRAVIRDVFTKLEQRGLIKRSPNKSAVVVRLDLDDVFHIYAVREMLEGLCARLAAQNAKPESWQDLVELFDGPMGEYVKLGDMERFIEGLQRLRGRLIAAASNPVLDDMLDLIHDKVSEIARRIIILPGRAEQGLKEHRALLKALRRGDADECERLRRANIRSSRQFLERYRRFVL